MEDKFIGMTVHQQAELAAIAVATKERALIEGAYVMAKKFPRNEDDARARIIKTCASYTFAEKAKYKKPIGKDFIIGPSIRLAEEMFRQWGHLRVEGVVLYDDDMRRIIQVSALDLQTGSNGIMQFTIEKTVERKNATGRIIISERMNSYNEKVSLVVATEDEVMVKQNATLSKYRRNLILQIIPNDILQDALAKVDATIKAGIAANPEREKKIVMDNFAKIGVLPSDIEKYLGHPIAQIVPDEIAELKDVYVTITENEDTWKNILATKIGEAAPGASITPAPSAAAFTPGDAKDHQSVKSPVISERQQLLNQFDALKTKLGEKKFNDILAKHKVAKIEDVQDTTLITTILGEMNWED